MVPKSISDKDDFSIVGGGVIGLATGWQLARAGKNVILYERGEVGKGASWVSAGMLAPQTEASHEEPELLKIGLESVSLYPKFLTELHQDSGEKVSLRQEGTLIIALDKDDLEALHRLFDFRVSLGLSVKWLAGSQACEMEPLLSPKVIAAVFIPDDLQVNPRLLLSALKLAFAKRGGILRENHPVDEIILQAHFIVTGLRIRNEVVPTQNVILACGAWSGQIAGIPEIFCPPIRPVKGQILSVHLPASCSLSHVVRTPRVYLVPKEDTRVIVGATSQEMGFDASKQAGPLLDLLQEAFRAVPSIYDSALHEIEVGFRPTSRDNLPLLGQSPIEGLIYANGHGRNGILLTPFTAYELCRLLVEGKAEKLAPFAPERFFSMRPSS